MKALVIGASGTIGSIVADALDARGYDVVRASRSSDPAVDMADPTTVAALLAQTEPLDAVIVAAGGVPFGHVTELSRADYLSGFTSKALGQIDVARQAFGALRDGGSITLTSGVLSRAPIAGAAAAAAANGALESYVITAAAEAPRGIRLNVVSPDVLASSPQHHAGFPGHRPVTDEEVALAYVRAVEGLGTGQVIEV